MLRNRTSLLLICLAITLSLCGAGCSVSSPSSIGELEPSMLEAETTNQLAEEFAEAEQEPASQDMVTDEETEIVQEEGQAEELSRGTTEESQGQVSEREQKQIVVEASSKTLSQAAPEATEVEAESETAVSDSAPISSASPSIVRMAIVGPQGEDYLILAETEVEWQAGDTVLDVLKRITREKRIQLEYRGRNRNVYVEGIDNLYEFDRGPLSGWVYRVNGTFPSSSAGVWTVEQGDLIEWLYTLDLGQDVGGNNQGSEGEQG